MYSGWLHQDLHISSRLSSFRDREVIERSIRFTYALDLLLPNLESKRRQESEEGDDEEAGDEEEQKEKKARKRVDNRYIPTNTRHNELKRPS